MGAGRTVTFLIPGPPQGKARPRVVRGAGGRVHTYTPDRTAAYEQLVREQYRKACAPAVGNSRLHVGDIQTLEARDVIGRQTRPPQACSPQACSPQVRAPGGGQDAPWGERNTGSGSPRRDDGVDVPYTTHGEPRVDNAGSALTQRRGVPTASVPAAGALPAGPIRLTVTAGFPVPKSASRKNRARMLAGEIRPAKRPDFDNIGKIIADALNGVAYRDDAQIVEAQVVKIYVDGPGETAVTLSGLEEEERDG